MNTASLFADPNLLQLESEAMINTDDAPSQRSADATAPFAPKARESRGLDPIGIFIWPHPLTYISSKIVRAALASSRIVIARAIGSAKLDSELSVRWYRLSYQASKAHEL